MAEGWIYRVQDPDGRGPYRPGMSRRWADVDGPSLPPPFWQEFGWSLSSIRHRFFPGEHAGCGFRSLEQLCCWFTAPERRELERLGYRVVTMHADRILAESDNQVVFARLTPLRDATVIPWPASRAAEAFAQEGEA